LPWLLSASFTLFRLGVAPTSQVSLCGRSSTNLLFTSPFRSACFHPSSWITAVSPHGAPGRHTIYQDTQAFLLGFCWGIAWFLARKCRIAAITPNGRGQARLNHLLRNALKHTDDSLS
jgi:hypothetical protein